MHEDLSESVLLKYFVVKQYYKRTLGERSGAVG
jgi:hypothetical protein